MTSNNLTYYALFGILLVTVVTATIAASSSSLLWPVTMSVFAQTEADGGDDAATMASGAANDNTAAPQLQMRIQMQLQLATTTTI